MKPGYVYAIGAIGGDRVKIGHASDPRHRLRNLRCGSSEDLRVLGVKTGTPADEKVLHLQFSALRICREWFWRRAHVEQFIASLDGLAEHVRQRRAPMNGFAEWAAQRGLTDEVLAEAVGLSRSMVTRLRLGQAMPSADSAIRIIAFSRNEVALPDFFRLRPQVAS